MPKAFRYRDSVCIHQIQRWKTFGSQSSSNTPLFAYVMSAGTWSIEATAGKTSREGFSRGGVQSIGESRPLQPHCDETCIRIANGCTASE